METESAEVVPDFWLLLLLCLGLFFFNEGVFGGTDFLFGTGNVMCLVCCRAEAFSIVAFTSSLWSARSMVKIIPTLSSAVRRVMLVNPLLVRPLG